MNSLYTLVLLLVVTGTLALQESAMCKVNTTVIAGCPGPVCCGACRAKYSVQGMWMSEIEARPSKPVCKKLCKKHFKACNSKCKCVVARKSIRDGLCKCSPLPNLLSSVLKNCLFQCKKAKADCIKNCNRPTRCAKATTVINFQQLTCGRCSRINCCTGTICPKPPVITAKCVARVCVA